MPRSKHMIKFYNDYNDQLRKDIKNTANAKAKGPIAFFLLKQRITQIFNLLCFK